MSYKCSLIQSMSLYKVLMYPLQQPCHPSEPVRLPRGTLPPGNGLSQAVDDRATSGVVVHHRGAEVHLEPNY